MVRRVVKVIDDSGRALRDTINVEYTQDKGCEAGYISCEFTGIELREMKKELRKHFFGLIKASNGSTINEDKYYQIIEAMLKTVASNIPERI